MSVDPGRRVALEVTVDELSYLASALLTCADSGAFAYFDPEKVNALWVRVNDVRDAFTSEERTACTVRICAESEEQRLRRNN